ncbi:GDSL-type esterase/lipase family protein [Streptacidiphilus jiangxiensis]|uniref:Lysophospholipase L1 n=1 Tax=Streptacidiphilus jiangxiensis TaxID=235985 RepID=A0A1H7RID3_STRJI|nr:GDSL-type esterase/lipase family protein [Streptacidiphilus jiangxiensis]SEL60011.1 Lysophospholipase L1 [Streptacidiphilus jiangxiensis]
MATWSTTYLAALGDPAVTPAFMPQPRAFAAAETVRQRVRVRRGGSALRLVLSNEFGTGPLVFDAVTVNSVPLTLAGVTRWEIPAGRTATSDPVGFAFADGDELTVDCVLGADAGAGAFLHSAQRTGEVLGSSERFGSLYWITRVLTDAPARGPVIVAVGDSLTRGDGTSPDLDQRYPDHLQRRVGTTGVVLNAGIGGNRLLGPLFGPTLPDRFDRDVLGVPEATHLLLMAGLNDLPAGATAPEITAVLFDLATRAQQHGIRPVLGTLTPMMGSVYETFRAAGNEATRLAVNEAVTAQKAWPVVDFAAAVADPADPSRLAPPFDSGDGVHLSDSGAEALAAAVHLDLVAAHA